MRLKLWIVWLFNYFILNLVYLQKLSKLKMHILYSIRLKYLKTRSPCHKWTQISMALNRKRGQWNIQFRMGTFFCIWLGLDLQLHIWILTQRQQLKTMDCTLYFSSYDKMKNSILFLSLYDAIFRINIYELRKKYTSTFYIGNAVA